MGRGLRIAVVVVIAALPAAALSAACSGDSSEVQDSGTNDACPQCEGSSVQGPDGATGVEDSGAPADSGSSRPNQEQPGTYMGFCLTLADGGYGCNSGLTCRLYGRVVTEGGTTKGCQERICTQRCDAGCPAPATGCGGSGYCDPEKCVP